MKMNRGSILAASVSLCCFSSVAQAGGFSVTIQSASGGGNAATGHAMAEDASAMFYNPALLSSLEGTQVNGGVAFTHADLSVKNTGSTLGANAGPLNGFPVVGTNDEPSTASNDTEPGGLSATPSLFYKRDIGAQKKVAFGLGINIPFGVATEYDDVSFARYEGTESGLTTVNINPALSWRASDKWDFGAGLNLQYGHAILAKAVDGALACQSIAGADGHQLTSADPVQHLVHAGPRVGRQALGTTVLENRLEQIGRRADEVGSQLLALAATVRLAPCPWIS